MANRPKMDRNERAKQFMPFDAVKGLREALREKECQVEEKLAPSTEIFEEQRDLNLDTPL